MRCVRFCRVRRSPRWRRLPGVSRQSVHSWIARYLAEGFPGRGDLAIPVLRVSGLSRWPVLAKKGGSQLFVLNAQQLRWHQQSLQFWSKAVKEAD